MDVTHTAATFVANKAEVIIRVRGLPFSAKTSEVVSNFENKPLWLFSFYVYFIFLCILLFICLFIRAKGMLIRVLQCLPSLQYRLNYQVAHLGFT